MSFCEWKCERKRALKRNEWKRRKKARKKYDDGNKNCNQTKTKNEWCTDSMQFTGVCIVCALRISLIDE